MSGVDRDTFREIFQDHWGEFKECHQGYGTRYYDEVVGKMLGVEKRRVDIVSTCAPVEERIFGGCVSPARVVFVFRVLRDTRMIL